MAEQEEVGDAAGSTQNMKEAQSKQAKKKKEKKRKHMSTEDEDVSVEESALVSRKKDKDRKKKEKRASKSDKDSGRDVVQMDDGHLSAKNDTEDDKEARRQTRKLDRQARRKEKEALLEQVPKVDEDGIAYTKLQIKRMLKRVKQGLPPVPTDAEERERLRNEAQLRREEEAELAGMIFKRDDEKDDDQNTPENSDDDKEEDEGGDEIDSDEEQEEEEQEGTGSEPPREDSNVDSKQSPKKKAKRSKPVPVDYVCQACKNKHTPAHWIYDCPNKVTVKGTNNKKKKDRGVNQPDARKVFVSGLPFDVKPSDVQQLFQACGKVASCKLVKFGDTGRCNGQAYVSFESDEAASKALKLSGTSIDNNKDDKKKKKAGSSTSPNKRPELKLKISRVLNRRLTKKKART